MKGSLTVMGQSCAGGQYCFFELWQRCICRALTHQVTDQPGAAQPVTAAHKPRAAAPDARRLLLERAGNRRRSRVAAAAPDEIA
jgi:hypothetical protein